MMVDIVSIQTTLCSNRDSYSAEQGHARRDLAIATGNPGGFLGSNAAFKLSRANRPR